MRESKYKNKLSYKNEMLPKFEKSSPNTFTLGTRLSLRFAKSTMHQKHMLHTQNDKGTF